MKTKRLLLLVTFVFITLMIGCEKECDCTYYSEEKVNNGSWTTTYESKWDDCKEEDFGTSVYTAYDGDKYYTHTYVKCR